MNIISARSNPVVHKIRQVRDGKLKKLLLCEGKTLVDDLLDSSFVVKELFCLKEEGAKVKKRVQSRKYPVTLLTKDVMQFSSDLKTSPGLMAIAERPQLKLAYDLPQERTSLIVLLHGLQLPQNVGAVLRVAEASGVSEVWTTRHSADIFSSKSLRGSAGSAFRVPIRAGWELSEALQVLSRNKVSLVAATQNGHQPYYDYFSTPA